MVAPRLLSAEIEGLNAPVSGAESPATAIADRPPAQRFRRASRSLIAPAAPESPSTAPLHGWRRVARDGLYVGGSTAIGHLLAACTSILLRWLLGPAEMGIWQGLKLVLSYANYTNLGTSKAAARELAIARGQGDPGRAQRALDLAFTFNTLTSGIYALALLGVAAWIGLTGAGPWRWAWCGGMIVVALLAMLQRHVTFLVTLLRSLQKFGVTSQVAVLEGALTLGVAGFATWRLGLPGLYLGTLLVFLGSWWLLHAGGAPRLKWIWNRAEFGQLIRVGGPMLVVGLLGSLFRSLDKLLILGLLDDREFQLGCYSLAILATTQLTGVASMLSIVMGPRVAELLGHAGEHRSAARLAARTIELQALIMTAAAAAMTILGPAVLSRLLPDYSAGLTALVIRAPGLALFGLTLPISNYLVAVNQQGRALAALGIAFVVAAAIGFAAVQGGWGLNGIALAMTLADGVQLAALIGLSFQGVLPGSEWRRLTFLASLITLPTLALAVALEMQFPGALQTWPVAAGKGLVVAVLFVATGGAAWRLGEWTHALRKDGRHAS